ncbi:BfmA/BtgA family mobilization protein [Aequorivita sp. CIP111184]|uniref:BfmA/BtgA family mobilization protein n=1 Tax=Aequorivita sp. CIP111184 TaxID=2211356 RepID=UPI000DBBD973|nr:BfmA/BtgA family mobilization protein [Aequorivita sp. CIP111184]SRX55033.1 hypothetical protein AEQU1_02054 [Aequorivita sp. CIP111184]
MKNIDTFATIRFKKSTAKRFREYSKYVGKSHSESMNIILDFFKNNGISPHENVGHYFKRLEGAILKKLDSIIAIIKNIEKSQLKPTTAMLSLLTEEVFMQKQPLLLENKTGFNNELGESMEDATIKIDTIRKQNGTLIKELEYHRKMTSRLLDKTILIKPKFGKAYFKLEISPENFENLKERLTDNY